MLSEVPHEFSRINQQVDYQQLCPEHFAPLIALGNQVHGDNYLDHESLTRYYHVVSTKELMRVGWHF